MSAHTPGPWKTRETATHIAVVGANNETLFHDDKRIPSVIEDAWLMSAAPDLLSAVRGLLDALPSATTHPAIKAARAAIAKATGAQQ